MSDACLLDTSALLAHYQEEPGHEIVDRLLEERDGEVFISDTTWLEFHIRLKELIPDAPMRFEALAIYGELLADCLPVTREVAQAAFDLRDQIAERIPNADAFIAATARLRGATLVHRDPHLALIPVKLVPQIVLPAKRQPTRGRRR